MILRALVAIGMVLFWAVADAQPADVYLQLLRLYRTDPASATASMARLKSDAINNGVRRCVPNDPSIEPACRRADVLAGAMLHLDAAEQVLGPNSEAALMHVRAGQRLLLGPAGLDGGYPSARDNAVFAKRWYALAARLLVAHGHGIAAATIITEGRNRYKEAPEFFVAMGVIAEWRTGVAGIGWLASDLRGAAINPGGFDQPLDFGPSTGTVVQRLQTASADYRRALAADPSHIGARLRLAWVHVLTGDSRVWDDVPGPFLETAEPEARVLARLIRGTAAERERNPEVALAEYREARRAAPGSQIACLALSSGQALNGDFDGSDATAAECLTLGNEPDHVDPWTLFRLGLMDETTTRWLRDEARRP